MAGLSVREFFERAGNQLHLTVLGQGVTSRQPVTVLDVNRAGLALTGFIDNFLWERIQIFGEAEITFLEYNTDAQDRCLMKQDAGKRWSTSFSSRYPASSSQRG